MSQPPPADYYQQQRYSDTVPSELTTHIRVEAPDAPGEVPGAGDEIDLDVSKLANPLSVTAAPKYMSSFKGLKCEQWQLPNFPSCLQGADCLKPISVLPRTGLSTAAS